MPREFSPRSQNAGRLTVRRDRDVQPVGAVASTTRYYLSVDKVKGAGDILLGGSRAVPALAAFQTPGDKSTGTVTLTIPSNAPVNKYYYVLACADDTTLVPENNEADNCLASAKQILVQWPDLSASAVSDPPSSKQPGSGFSVTETVQNFSWVGAGASTTRYYLSTDMVKGAGDVLLTGTRSVAALGPWASSTGTVNVTIPPGTSQGTYYLLACANDLNSVKESFLNDNCVVSVKAVTVMP